MYRHTRECLLSKKIKKKIWNIRIIFITLQRQQEKKVFLVLFIKKKIKH